MPPKHGRRRQKAVYLRRRIMVGTAGVAILALVAVGLTSITGTSGSSATTQTSTTVVRTTTTTVQPRLRIPPGKPIVDRRLVRLSQYYSNSITPKSITASGAGLVMAQNMVYRHTVTAFNATTGAVAKTIPASVQLSNFGFTGHPGTVLGAPVEGAFTPDAKYFWFTNYSMTGPTMGPEGLDSCTPYTQSARGETPSYAMRINVASFQIDRVVQVGYVPKFVETSPDGKWVLVTNWCSWTINIIDANTAKVVKTLSLPGTPRGIAVDPTSHAAYVAIMGGTVLVKVNLLTQTIVGQIYVGPSPRTVVLSPNGIYAYVSLNGPGAVVKVDLRTGRVVASVHTGSEARSLVISSDGTALFVVNYASSTMTMLRAADLRILQNVVVPSNPIGITYDPLTAQVWVSSYSGYVTRYATQ